MKKYSEEVLKEIKRIADWYLEEYETISPSGAYIAKQLKLDVGTVRRILKEMGYLITKANYGKSNGAKSGEEHHMFGKKQSEETQEKKRQKLKGRKRPKEVFEKVIETRRKNGNLVPSHVNVRYYDDIKMTLRSSWEADYIRYLNFIGIKWEYEQHSFEIKEENGTFASYTPDFYIPSEDYYVEIKGFYSEENKRKMNLFKNQYPNIHIKFIFREDYNELTMQYKNVIPFWGNKGTPTSFSNNIGAKLDVEKVKKIKLLLNEGIKNIEIAKQFNVTEGAISAIKNNRTWSYVIVENEEVVL